VLDVTAREIQIGHDLSQFCQRAEQLIDIQLARIVLINQFEGEDVASVETLINRDHKNALHRVSEPCLAFGLLQSLENVRDFSLLLQSKRALIFQHPRVGKCLLTCHSLVHVGLQEALDKQFSLRGDRGPLLSIKVEISRHNLVLKLADFRGLEGQLSRQELVGNDTQ